MRFLGELWIRFGDFFNQYKAYSLARRFYSLSKGSELATNTYNRIAFTYMMQLDYENALEYFKTSIKLYPDDNHHAYCYAADILNWKEKFSEATDLLQTAMSQDTTCMNSNVYYITSLRGENKFESAITFLNNKLGLISKELQELEKIDRELLDLDEKQTHDTTRQNIEYNLLVLYVEKIVTHTIIDQIDQAKETIRKLQTLNLNNQLVLYSDAFVEHHRGRYQRALKIFSKIEGNNKYLYEPVQLLYACVLIDLKEYDKAEEILTQGLESYPTYYRFHTQLARLSYLRKNVQKAQEWLILSSNINPYNHSLQKLRENIANKDIKAISASHIII